LVRLLLDTHTLLWWLIRNSSLSPRAQGLLENKANTVLVSAASAWEMATKVRLGKLDVAVEVVQNFLWYVERERFQAIPLAWNTLFVPAYCRVHTKTPSTAC
jgi:PIN domain nuclease of toxin-antitoxin system